MMKKNFQSTSLYRDRTGRTRKIIGIVIFIVLLFIIALVYRDSLGSFFRFLSTGMWQVRTQTVRVVGNEASVTLRSKSSILQENNDLREKLNILSVMELENKFLKEENDSLKEQLGRGKYNQKRILAVILSRPPVSPYDTLVFDVGTEDGVRQGDLIALGSTVLGQIKSVDARTSLGVLFSSPGLETQVSIASSTVQTTAYGRGGGNYYMRLPADADVSEGDLITIPSIHPRILGSVARVEEASADSFKVVLFRSPVNIEQLQWLDILETP